MSAYNNSTSELMPFDSGQTTVYASTRRILVLVFQVALLLAIVLGNTMTIFAIWKTERLRTTTNKFVMCLAASDLLVGVVIGISMLLTDPVIVKYINITYWNIAWIVLMWLSITSSINCIFMIALERYMFIVHPLRYHAFVSSYKTQIGIAALFSWTVSLPVSIIWKNECTTDAYCYFYTIISTPRNVLILSGVVVEYIFMIVFYGNIAKTAISQKKRVRDLGESFRSIKSSDFKLAKMMFSVMGIFTLCFSPWAVVKMLDIIFNTHHYQLTAGLFTGLPVLLNSGMNFFIYVTMDKEFRKAIKTILCGR